MKLVLIAEQRMNEHLTCHGSSAHTYVVSRGLYNTKCPLLHQVTGYTPLIASWDSGVTGYTPRYRLLGEVVTEVTTLNTRGFPNWKG